MPFEPVGPVARWRILYDHLFRPANFGDVITYEQMAEALGLDPEADKSLIQTTVQRVGKELEPSDNKQVEAVRNVGYRIMDPEEHVQVARRRQRRSSRQLKRGHGASVHVDFSGMDPETRKALETIAAAFQMQMEFNRRIDVRQSKLETALETVVTGQRKSQAEIESLKDRLARLESNQ